MTSERESTDLRVKVLLPLPFDTLFSYSHTADQNPQRGDIVRVEFRSKQLYGVVWEKDLEKTSSESSRKIKPLLENIPLFRLTEENLHFLSWVASYTLTPQGLILKMMLAAPDAFKTLKRARSYKLPDAPQLDFCKRFFEPEQQQAYEVLTQENQKGYAVTLIDGITGSGKTEVYLEALQACFRMNRQALILLPQISLAPQIADRFAKRYGVKPTLWHSDLSLAQRREAWKHIQQNQAKIVIGARSALFLPYGDLGIIVVDEEHDHAFKQEEGVIYQARDLAVARAYGAKIPCILTSATPSLETFYNCDRGRYRQVKIQTRYGKAQLPQINIIDMRRSKDKSIPEKYWISQPLADKIETTVTSGEQVLLYLNRRGYAPLTLCGACGHKIECTYCSTWLVYHKQYERFLCHQCGHQCSLSSLCQHCGAKDDFVPCGPGVERIAEEMRRRFPDFKTEIFSSDLIEDAQAMGLIIKRILNREIDVLIGTQMIAKGHHFPNLTLVGVIDADLGLRGGDLRASEKTYQLLHQVAGRAGRAEKLGYVYLQTFTPDHPVLDSILKGERDHFIEQEMDIRHQGEMPPFSKLASIIFSSEDLEAVEATARYFVRHVPHFKEVYVLGPAPAPLALIRGKYRWRVLLKVPKNLSIQSFIRKWLEPLKVPPKVKVKIDIDPYSFL